MGQVLASRGPAHPGYPGTPWPSVSRVSQRYGGVRPSYSLLTTNNKLKLALTCLSARLAARANDESNGVLRVVAHREREIFENFFFRIGGQVLAAPPTQGTLSEDPFG